MRRRLLDGSGKGFLARRHFDDFALENYINMIDKSLELKTMDLLNVSEVTKDQPMSLYQAHTISQQ